MKTWARNIGGPPVSGPQREPLYKWTD